MAAVGRGQGCAARVHYPTRDALPQRVVLCLVDPAGVSHVQVSRLGVRCPVALSPDSVLLRASDWRSVACQLSTSIPWNTPGDISAQGMRRAVALLGDLVMPSGGAAFGPETEASLC